MIIGGVEYQDIISKIYDLTDYKTKCTLLFCNEAQKGAVLEQGFPLDVISIIGEILIIFNSDLLILDNGKND